MQLLTLAVLATLWGVASTASALPLSDCYALSKESYLYDFTDKVGRELELEGKGSDFVLRFCVDVQNRSNNGYINYGRFSPQSMPKHKTDDVDFLQVYKYGDLMHCEHIGNDLTGHETEVKIMCGTCPNGAACKDEFGCICNVTYNHNLCKAKVLAAVDCSRQGPRIFSDFSIGLQPRGCEVIKNGITQREYRKSFRNHSFESSQKSLSLYVTSKAAFPGDLRKTYLQVQPSQGLEVGIGNKPTLSSISDTDITTLLEVDWKCKEIRDVPYVVNISIPMEGYDPISFFLFKWCRTHDSQKGTGLSSMKMLKAISLITLVGLILLGIAYLGKRREQCKADAADAAPTLPLISKGLDRVDGRKHTFQVVTTDPLI